MATAGFTVTSAKLKTTAEEISALIEQYKTKVESLSALELQLRGMWEGEANNAFRNAFASDKVQLDNFHQVIKRYVASLQQAAVSYENAEMKAAEIASTRSYR